MAFASFHESGIEVVPLTRTRMTDREKTNRAGAGKTLGPRVHESPFADADARVFVCVAQAGSFARAAALSRLTPSAVSKAVARLESALGLKLLVRTTRSLHLTDEGLAFRDRCERAFALLSEAAEEVSTSARALGGTIRIGLPPLFGTCFLPRVLARLLPQHPALRVEVVSTMCAADLVDRRLDLAIVVGPLPDSAFVARPLGYGQFVTSPRLIISRVEEPPRLRRASPSTTASPTHGQTVAARPSYSADHPARQVCLRRVHPSGPMTCNTLPPWPSPALGIAQLPLFAVAGELQSKLLVRVLERHDPEPKLASLVFPDGRALPRRVRVLVDELVSTSSEMTGATLKRG